MYVSCTILINRAYLVMEMFILHEFSCMRLMSHRSICLMRSVLSDNVSISMYGSQTWQMVVAFLFAVTYPPIFLIFTPRVGFIFLQ